MKATVMPKPALPYHLYIVVALQQSHLERVISMMAMLQVRQHASVVGALSLFA